MHGVCNKYRLSANDIVVARTGATVGHAKRIRRHPDSVFASYLVRFRLSNAVDPAFVGAVVESTAYRDFVRQHAGGSAQPNANAKVLGSFPFLLPDRRTQECVGHIFDALDDLIENNRRRIELLEQMAQAIYREWFVHFRFPGHEDATFVASPLGTLPEGWQIKRIAGIAGSERNAVTGGPFGSKLGRKDYVEAGVPVLRGANLRLHGGFDEADLVFVSNEKAEELRACLARRGDIVVTQRGTLGQVGLISDRSRFDRYLLSQSQMKITVDSAKSASEFVYAQLRSKASTDRFIAQAMTSGVPHVNLALLRG
ncbi:MAG: restriction endonuclease subunit S, partial [Actinobacteria bacterium]|nr:restriction endonuclease subunit S [Actinomycetota bacterium]